MMHKLREGRARFIRNVHNPVLRRQVGILFLGKIIGLAIVLLLMNMFLGQAAHAQGTAASTADVPTINAVNTVWTLVAAFLVFAMQVGFVMLEAGFARSRESVNILVEGIADTCICGITFWAWGFAFMFESGTPLIGTTGFMLQGLPATYGTTGVPLLAFWVFQFAFADTCSTVTSGAMIGRCGFIGDLLYSVGVSGFIYPIIGHWAWGPDGWLNTIHPAAFHDFAGSTVVHTIGGFISLAGALGLAPRLGRQFKRDGGGPMPGHALITADLLESLRIDDPVGAVAVHGANGIWGTLSLGLFATGQYGAPTPTGADNSAGAVVPGLLYGGGANQLIAQAIGSAVVTVATFA